MTTTGEQQLNQSHHLLTYQKHMLKNKPEGVSPTRPSEHPQPRPADKSHNYGV